MMSSSCFLSRAALSASLFVSIAAVGVVTPLSAQEASGAEVQDDAGSFYKAFYLARGARRFDAAAAHYRKFLANHSDHELARAAARELHALLMRTGKRKEAAAARKEFGELFRVTIDTPSKDANKTDAKKAGKAKGVSRDAAASKGKGGAESKSGPEAPQTPAKAAKPSPEMAARIARLTKELTAAKAAGDNQRALMLEAQLERAKRRSGGKTRTATVSGARSTNRAAGGIGARAAQIDFTKMDDQATAQMIERMEAMRGRIVQRLDEKTRQSVDAKWSALRKQLDGGDKAGAQKTWSELRGMLFRRR